MGASEWRLLGNVATNPQVKRDDEKAREVEAFEELENLIYGLIKEVRGYNK